MTYALRNIIGIALFAFLLQIGKATAVAILDQENAASGNFPALAVANDRRQIQTFTVGVTGDLAGVSVQVDKGSETVEDLVLSIWSTDTTGLPQHLLATSSVAPSAVTNQTFLSFDFAPDAIAASAGEILAIELNSNASNVLPFEERYLWRIGGQYDGGMAYTQLGSSFFLQSEDFLFKTYMLPEQPSTVPEQPSTAVILGIGLGALVATSQGIQKRDRAGARGR